MANGKLDIETARARSFAMLIDLGTKLQVLADRELSASGLTTRQWFLCLVLDQSGKPLGLSDAARRMGTSRQNAKQLALKLERGGFLSIARDENDGRGLKLSLTDACRAFWSQRTAEDHRLLASIFQPLGAEETLRLYGALAALNRSAHRLLADGSQPFSVEEP